MYLLFYVFTGLCIYCYTYLQVYLFTGLCIYCFTFLQVLIFMICGKNIFMNLLVYVNIIFYFCSKM